MTAAPREKRIHAELVSQLYGQLPVGLAATVVNALILAFILKDVVAHATLISWLSVVMLVSLARYVSLIRYRRSEVKADHARSWSRRFMIGLGASGMVWGAAGIFLFPPASVPHQVFIAFVLGGMVAGSVGAFSAVKAAVYVFAVPALCPIIVRLAIPGDDIHVAMAGMATLFAVLMGFTAKNVGQKNRAWVEMQQFLSDMVDERTNELLKTNEQLHNEVNERKRTEKALGESERRFRQLVEDVNEVIYSVDASGVLDYVSPALETCLGYEPESVIGRSFFSFVHPEDLPRVRAKFEEVLAGTLGPSEYRILSRSGEYRWVRSSSKPILEDGRSVGLRGVFSDITEDRNLRANLERVQRMESMGTLAGGIAHDFNNILAIILGNSELALDDVAESHTLRQNLEEVRAACMRGKDVVRQILAFSRKTEHELKPVRMGSLVEEASKLLRASIPTTIDIRYDLAAESDTVMADPTQIHQVLMNLSSNAAQAMGEAGGGTLEISLVDEELSEDLVREYEGLTPGSYVRLTVRDNGPGIEPRILDRIFEPYFTTKAVNEGSGMGLSVVQGIVEVHSGSVRVETEVGKGASFHVLLPKTEEHEIPAARTPEGFPAGNERILFVDDEEALAKMGKLTLERLGYQVESTTSPVEALEVFRGNPDRFDLVVTDMTMPQMTGESLAGELMAIRPDIRIVLCTGYSRIMDEDKARTMGIRGFIMKPLSRSDMARTVRTVLDEQ